MVTSGPGTSGPGMLGACVEVVLLDAAPGPVGRRVRGDGGGGGGGGVGIVVMSGDAVGTEVRMDVGEDVGIAVGDIVGLKVGSVV